MSAATDHAAGADRLLIGQALTVVRDGRRILDEVDVRVEGGQVLAVTGPSGSVEKVVNAAGFSVIRDYVGHGVGREMHEEPSVPNYGTPGRGAKLQEGMTFALEPMVSMGIAR